MSASNHEWCVCREGPYIGTQPLGEPVRCERCTCLTRPDEPRVNIPPLSVWDEVFRQKIAEEHPSWLPSKAD